MLLDQFFKKKKLILLQDPTEFLNLFFFFIKRLPEPSSIIQNFQERFNSMTQFGNLDDELKKIKSKFLKNYQEAEPKKKEITDNTINKLPINYDLEPISFRLGKLYSKGDIVKIENLENNLTIYISDDTYDLRNVSSQYKSENGHLKLKTYSDIKNEKQSINLKPIPIDEKTESILQNKLNIIRKNNNFEFLNNL